MEKGSPLMTSFENVPEEDEEAKPVRTFSEDSDTLRKIQPKSNTFASKIGGGKSSKPKEEP